MFTFGAGMYGQLGHNSNQSETLPRKVFELMGSEVTILVCGRLVQRHPYLLHLLLLVLLLDVVSESSHSVTSLSLFFNILPGIH